MNAVSAEKNRAFYLGTVPEKTAASDTFLEPGAAEKRLAKQWGIGNVRIVDT